MRRPTGCRLGALARYLPVVDPATARRSLEVVCCSLEPWDDVWRRNQFLAAGLLGLDSDCRLLFVEPATDIPWALLHRRPMRAARLRPVGLSGRMWAVTPRKWAPRRVAPGVDRRLGEQVRHVAATMGFRHPVLWVNDSSYALLARATRWPTVYDVTDDWLLAGLGPREMRRQQNNDALLLDVATEVVVCSPALQVSRGASRPVRLIPNAVDVDHFRRPLPRPADLPDCKTVVYAGTLSGGRLDLDLCVELATRLPRDCKAVFVGPNACSPAETRRLAGAGIVLLGARPYETLPGYLQHAEVLIVPHVVSPFTESLDPIKAREVLAVGRAAVTTAVAGMRDLGPPVVVATREAFTDAVLQALARPRPLPGPGPLTGHACSWTDAAGAFLEVVRSVAARDLRSLPSRP